MAVDITIMVMSLSVVGYFKLALSILCELVLNLIIGLNQRSDRYQVTN
ncbi:MAG: hypothetical protein ACK5MF_11460 [Vibrio sp.]